LILGEVELGETSPKGLFQVLWVVYTTQIFKENNLGDFTFNESGAVRHQPHNEVVREVDEYFC